MPLIGVLLALALLSLTGRAQGQEVVETEGAADFRNPPLLADGQYEDTIVTGESVWYSVLYRNDQPYLITVDLTDIDVEADEDLELEASFVGPTLGSVSSGLVLEGWASYQGGTTNLWYIRVDLATEGRLGVEHTLRLDISGTQSTRLEPCDSLPDCNLDEALAEIQSQIEDLKAEIAKFDDVDTEEEIRSQINELEQRIDAAESDRRQADDSIAAICAPEPDCEAAPAPGPTTPMWALFLGGIVALGGAGFLITTMRGRRT